MYKPIRFIFILLILCINKGSFEQLPLLTSNNVILTTKTSTITSTVYLTSFTTSIVIMTPLPDLKLGNSLIENPTPTPSTISPSHKVDTKPELFNIAIIIGSLLTGCIINAVGFIMYWWYKKKFGFMVELYLCIVVMVVMMVAVCVEKILLEFMNVIYTT
ncbi:hypothetical protein C1645_776097 [Glomus cerebriforme]|uniref:Uncharacterized protein n=1 Tax=Glomus cerebriforme TaxID=658196 RepID=A0A397SVE9_9GLOM|nr:hypothetical protein C1645_776097 [Glomus cerebriforme]